MAPRHDTSIGLAIIGCGMVGTHRAMAAARDPRVGFLALYDIDKEAAAKLGEAAAADLVAGTMEEALEHPQVDTAIIATTGGPHRELGLAAIESTDTVLVEKPFCRDAQGAQALVDAARQHDVGLYAGYTQRFRRRFLRAKHQVLAGEIGTVRGGFGKFYTTRALPEERCRESAAVTPTTNNFPHLADLAMWYTDGKELRQVVARESRAPFAGHERHPMTMWCMLEFADESVFTMGTSWELPSTYPAFHASIQVDVFGTEGAITIDDTHRDYIISSERELQTIIEPYKPDTRLHTAFMGTFPPGDEAFDKLYGPMDEESHAFLGVAATGEPHPILATGEDGLRVRRLIRAVQDSSASGQPVDFA